MIVGWLGDYSGVWVGGQGVKRRGRKAERFCSFATWDFTPTHDMLAGCYVDLDFLFFYFPF